LLAEALDDVLSDRRPEAEALSDYERRRNEATMEDYRANLYQAELNPPPPGLLELRASVRGDQEATNRHLLGEDGAADDVHEPGLIRRP